MKFTIKILTVYTKRLASRFKSYLPLFATSRSNVIVQQLLHVQFRETSIIRQERSGVQRGAIEAIFPASGRATSERSVFRSFKCASGQVCSHNRLFIRNALVREPRRISQSLWHRLRQLWWKYRLCSSDRALRNLDVRHVCIVHLRYCELWWANSAEGINEMAPNGTVNSLVNCLI